MVIIQICYQCLRIPEYKLLVGQITFRDGLKNMKNIISSDIFYTPMEIIFCDSLKPSIRYSPFHNTLETEKS